MQPQHKRIDKLGRTGIVLAVIGILAAFVIAALSFGGVMSMGAVGICLLLAGVTGIAGIIVLAFWLKPWLREGTRVAVAIFASLSIVLGVYYLYRWIEVNGHRPEENIAKSLAHPVGDAQSEALPTKPKDSRPAVATHQRPESPRRATGSRHGSGKNSANNAIAGDGQIMNNSPAGMQQRSQGGNSPKITIQAGGVASFGQSGGQTAQTINNYGPQPVPPRRISQSEKPDLIAYLTEKRTAISISAITNDKEAFDFAQDWWDVLNAAHWKMLGGGVGQAMLGGPPLVGCSLNFYGVPVPEGTLITLGADDNSTDRLARSLAKICGYSDLHAQRSLTIPSGQLQVMIGANPARR
ncbi:MAG: DUF308 domain-containing protein [Bryobacteraceae bacterium]